MKRRRHRDEDGSDSSSSSDESSSSATSASEESRERRRRRKVKKSKRSKSDGKSRESTKKRKHKKHHKKSRKSHKKRREKPSHQKVGELPPAVSDAQKALQRIREQADASREASKRAMIESMSQPAGGNSFGPMTAAASKDESERVRKVYEPETGRMRLVKGSGEIVEQIVSKGQQEAIRKRATMKNTMTAGLLTDKTEWTGREKFPSQHPWFGYG